MMGWSPFAEWCERDPKRPWNASVLDAVIAEDEAHMPGETEPVVELWNMDVPDFPFDCFDLFHSQRCGGFGAERFCPSCGGEWKHPLHTTTGEVHRPYKFGRLYPETFDQEADRLEEEDTR